MAQRMELIALPDFPLVEPGDDLAAYILQSLHRADIALVDGDVLVLAQKIFSKAENRYAYLNQVEVSPEAYGLADKTDKDPRLVQLILDESVEVVRHRPGAIIVEHRLGYVHANAGIDQSNIESDFSNQRVLLLPEDPDRSVAVLRRELGNATGVDIAVIMNDSAGRAWRNGTVGFALGTAGLQPLVDLVGEADLFGRALETTTVAVADELAAAASFLMGQAAEAVPAVLIRGANLPRADIGSGSLIRERSQDLFR
ncbi:coenzyme F420-0:L-glutamate ligase [Microbulbifer agarilyticus]|uniref:coenzyme F420-0:L-glutamate ligase n=1 Tax=Microbulbifer agarilyticus TaxID=260552 RepID=UPI001CD4A825|nr:coenzyme F420-0:L-glutamate ligase [Microbulbifer agarilyticus]MCA0900567.1 coenzyme F420-0:L-glutamate ligase [Microbulbifer agarilyticus]